MHVVTEEFEERSFRFTNVDYIPKLLRFKTRQLMFYLSVSLFHF